MVNTPTAADIEFINALSVTEIKLAIARLIQVSDALLNSNFKAHVLVKDVIDALDQRFQLIG
jgi:hypothetical protein